VSGIVVPRDVVVVEGPEAGTYLQGQVSQDVLALDIGDSAFALLLQPQGKVDAWLRVTRIAEAGYALDVDAGWGDAVLARLRRFLLRTKAELRVEPEWSVVSYDEPFGGGGWPLTPEVPGRFDVLLRAPAAPPGSLARAEAEAYEVARIKAGVPRMGRELDEKTIPAAAGVVDRSVSFTKGCYTGQELVARIDARGDRVPTRLRGIIGDVEAGAELTVDGKVVGTVTSAAGGVALAYVRREVDVPAIVGSVRIEALPLP
jgi:folate-binding protein YgfZ